MSTHQFSRRTLPLEWMARGRAIRCSVTDRPSGLTLVGDVRTLDGSSEVCHSESMSMEVWWSTLRPETRDWLIAHNGEAVPASVIEEIARAGGSVTSDAWWVGQNGPTGFYFSDAAIDWVEELANGEMPAAP